MEQNEKRNEIPSPSFQNFEKATSESFSSYQKAKATGTLKEFCSEPYLEPLTNHGGGVVEQETEIVTYVNRFRGCGKTAQKLEGYISRLDYWGFITCKKWFCDSCGKKGGTIHRRRMKRLMEGRMKSIDKQGLRQIICTIPIGEREKFQSRRGISSLYRMAVKAVRSVLPGAKMVVYVHLFGDKDPGKFNPHVNIHVLEAKGTRLTLYPEDLAEIKKRWRWALQGYGCGSMDMVNVHYSFTDDVNRIKHRIKYMSRPNPGPENFKPLMKNIPLLHLCVIDLKGFNFIRYYGPRASEAIDVDLPEDDINESERFAGEKLIFCPGETMSRTEFDLRYRKDDYDELSPGFYRIKKKS